MARYCPECGTEGSDSNFCANCGTQLQGPEGDATESAGSTGPSRRTWITVASGVGVLVAIVLIAVLLGGGSDSASESHASAEGSDSSGVEECIERWNSQPGGDGDTSGYDTQGESWGGTGRIMMLSWLDYGWDAYVSIGFSEDYDGRCLMTAATPDGTQSAEQFIENSDGGFSLATGGEDNTIDDVPESAKNWNAHLESNGDLAPGSQ